MVDCAIDLLCRAGGRRHRGQGLGSCGQRARGEAEACREGIAKKRALKDSTIRTILRKLEEKGYVTHDVDGRTFLYRAVDSKRSVAVEAARQLIDRFCGGSVEELLVGLVDNQVLEPRQLQKLAEKIASRKEKKS